MARRVASVLLVQLVAAALGAGRNRIVCETTVTLAGDGRLEIELWEDVAPIGAQRLVDLVEDGFFTDLPFFR